MDNLLQYAMNRPVCSAHEHISSLLSFGMVESIFFPSDVKPALQPVVPTGLRELLLSPYYSSVLYSLGYSWRTEEPQNKESFARFYSEIWPFVKKTRNTGTFLALERALTDLYGVKRDDWEDPDAMFEVSEKIKRRYENYSGWFEEVMEKSVTSVVIKPVHPQYLLDKAFCPGKDELKYTYPIARVDSLMGCWKNGRMDWNDIGSVFGHAVNTLDDILEITDMFFNCIRGKTVGIKQLQAYTRSLKFASVPLEEARQAYQKCTAGQDPAAALVAGDYIMQRILENAEKEKLVFQVHTGMTHLADSNPAMLEPLMNLYPQVRFVLLHAYPFASNAAYLGRCYANCFVDTSWLLLQGKGILKKCLAEYLDMIPYEKITISVDATSLEEYYGGIQLSRETAAETVEEKARQMGWSAEQAREVLDALLCDNAYRLYNLYQREE